MGPYFFAFAFLRLIHILVPTHGIVLFFIFSFFAASALDKPD